MRKRERFTRYCISRLVSDIIIPQSPAPTRWTHIRQGHLERKSLTEFACLNFCGRRKGSPPATRWRIFPKSTPWTRFTDLLNNRMRRILDISGSREVQLKGDPSAPFFFTGSLSNRSGLCQNNGSRPGPGRTGLMTAVPSCSGQWRGELAPPTTRWIWPWIRVRKSPSPRRLQAPILSGGPRPGG
jgi:hypothetical protein